MIHPEYFIGNFVILDHPIVSTGSSCVPVPVFIASAAPASSSPLLLLFGSNQAGMHRAGSGRRRRSVSCVDHGSTEWFASVSLWTVRGISTRLALL